MKVALVKPPQQQSLVRGVGFYTDRLIPPLSKLCAVSLVDFSYLPDTYRKYDLVHFPYFDLFHLNYPPFLDKKKVVTVHDLTPLKFPKHFPLGKRAKIVWPIKKEVLRRVDAIITDSQSSKKDIVEIVGCPQSKIFTVYLAPDPQFQKINDTTILYSIKVKYNLPEKFVLYVGGVNWNKNLPTLVRACQQINMPLVIVGEEALGENLDFNHAESQSFKEVLALVKNDPKILRLGFVSTEDLVGIYNLAKVYVQPSFYEGFGLPVLEAMSCGTPVICGKNSSLPEIAGEAAIYADVSDPSDLALKIHKLPKSDLEKIKRQSLTQAAKFSWDKTAQEVYEVYQKVLAGK